MTRVKVMVEAKVVCDLYWGPQIRLPTVGDDFKIEQPGTTPKDILTYRVSKTTWHVMQNPDGSDVMYIVDLRASDNADTCDPLADWHVFKTREPRCICGAREAFFSGRRKKK